LLGLKLIGIDAAEQGAIFSQELTRRFPGAAGIAARAEAAGAGHRTVGMPRDADASTGRRRLERGCVLASAGLGGRVIQRSRLGVCRV
jgi:hypothetical protein